MTVIDEIAAERERQKSVEGWTEEHDDQHTKGELAKAAAAYAIMSPLRYLQGNRYVVPEFWPWALAWWKPKDRRRDLIRAGALIVAEIERLDRMKGYSDDRA